MEATAESAGQLVPHDECAHPYLRVTPPLDGNHCMRLTCQACGKTVDFPLTSLERSVEDQTQLLRMTFGEAWVRRMAQPEQAPHWSLSLGKEIA